MPGASATLALLGSQSSFSHGVPLAASAEPAAVADKPKAASRGDTGTSCYEKPSGKHLDLAVKDTNIAQQRTWLWMQALGCLCIYLKGREMSPTGSLCKQPGVTIFKGFS